jgi:hypothetical protein
MVEIEKERVIELLSVVTFRFISLLDFTRLYAHDVYSINSR